ncbi:hypothetical protein [Methylotuvimicrobium sp. KM2]|uniref:hypothetical protein n=1 Tax=Methylotuvimicrobium sp. KM2 TaxID=3133976 RepID=UPI003100DB90
MKQLSLLILPLVGGYAFSSIWIGSLYHSARESGDRLYFRALFYALWLLSISYLLHFTIYVRCDEYGYQLLLLSKIINPEISTIAPFGKESQFVVYIYSLVLGPLLALLLNIPKWLPSNRFACIYDFTVKKTLLHAIKTNDFEQFIFNCFYQNKPALFTLASNKLYLGLLIDAPNPVQDRRYIKFLPILSGFREKDTQQIKFTTDYQFIFENNFNVEDFEIVIPLEQIVSAHQFDLTIYNERFIPSSGLKASSRFNLM